MNHERIYAELVSRAKCRDVQTEYTERHHIVPRCEGGGDAPCNLVRLTAREHYIAHWLLFRIYKTQGTAWGWARMACPGKDGRRYVSHTFAFARKARSHSAETRAKIASSVSGPKNQAFGKPKSKENRENISKAMRACALGRTDVRAIVIDGESASMAEWARRSGRAVSVIHYRIKNGWSERDSVFASERGASNGQSANKLTGVPE